MIRAANALQIGAVEEAAVGFITSGLTDETAVQWLIFAAEYAPCGGEHGKALLERCLAHVSKHFKACIFDEAFGRLPAAVLQQLIGDDDLDAVEEEVLEALHGWWDVDRVERQASLPELLPFVRFPLLGVDARLALYSDPLLLGVPNAVSMPLLRECAKVSPL